MTVEKMAFGSPWLGLQFELEFKLGSAGGTSHGLM